MWATLLFRPTAHDLTEFTPVQEAAHISHAGDLPFFVHYNMLIFKRMARRFSHEFSFFLDWNSSN